MLPTTTILATTSHQAPSSVQLAQQQQSNRKKEHLPVLELCMQFAQPPPPHKVGDSGGVDWTIPTPSSSSLRLFDVRKRTHMQSLLLCRALFSSSKRQKQSSSNTDFSTDSFSARSCTTVCVCVCVGGKVPPPPHQLLKLKVANFRVLSVSVCVGMWPVDDFTFFCHLKSKILEMNISSGDFKSLSLSLSLSFRRNRNNLYSIKTRVYGFRRKWWLRWRAFHQRRAHQRETEFRMDMYSMNGKFDGVVSVLVEHFIGCSSAQKSPPWNGKLVCSARPEEGSVMEVHWMIHLMLSGKLLGGAQFFT